MVGKGHININVMDNLETLTKLSIQTQDKQTKLF